MFRTLLRKQNKSPVVVTVLPSAVWHDGIPREMVNKTFTVDPVDIQSDKLGKFYFIRVGEESYVVSEENISEVGVRH